MKFIKSALVTSVLAAASFGVAANTTINGAGATFPHPIYAKWAEQYQKETGVQINYQAIGSGGGIRQITAKTVDFGATDAPLTIEELNKEGMIQFPMVMGAIVPVVNIPGIDAGEVKLTGKVLADIYLGNIKNWNDPAIAAINNGVELPSQPIYVVHRSDGSGTTFNFTEYLDQVSPEWHEQIGVGKDITWPSKATTIGGNGNAGVANFVNRTRGAIGYVEYAFAKQNNLAYTQMQAHDGDFLMPTMENFQSAAANADWENAPGYHLLLNNQPGAHSWPMTAATFILMHKDQADAGKAKEIVKFFEWSYTQGKAAEELDYIPMPTKVVNMVNDTWKQGLKSDGQTIIR
ncbi:phosphate ABC transporter substrate-binding protein PstS [Vibrio coralliilyticus]|uniref:phosphate ABC transporter substrate-binding protein PstS n=1 Tax=Vibrio coralliilyticus TaxID=190893 RepID=UPI000BAC1CD8|nr:phosphate ABC transporter substrate-binding protein PstS [Vibrio coralliilyticus]NOI74741.1 phosphate ABC transporter substrate-binding protein PstS [Vibrio coralliilyticus]PAW05328.1 phosphate ABC transporter substrate-binding protein PstS [Vibrio coralliilyticus]